MRLTRGEAWWLRRRRMGKTQATVARQLGVSEEEYRAWEQDRSNLPLLPLEGFTRHPLSFGEYSALARRRAGLSVAEVAHAYGVSKQTLIKMEHDRTTTAPDLARWWSLQGYISARDCGPVPIAVPRGLGRASV